MRFIQTECYREKLATSGIQGRIMLGDGMTPPEEYRGRVQCVYIDPPFNTGEKFELRMRVGEDGWTDGLRTITLPAFSDHFSTRQEYRALIRGLVRAAYDLLTETGAFFLHLDSREAPYARVICDEIFGESNLVNEIIWAYQTGGRTLKRFSRKHDTILFYQKSKKLYFNIQAVPVSRTENRQNHMKRQVDENGRAYRTIKSGGKTYTYYDDAPVYPGDVWTDVSHLQQKDPQRTGYDTQKPVALLKRIISCTTQPGDLVADLCCGSGTTLAAAMELDRQYLGMDLSRSAITVSRKRLTDSALTVDWPFGASGAQLEAEMIPGIGFYDVKLISYIPPQGEDAAAPGLDAVDQWAVGFVKDGVFYAQDLSSRLKKLPRLNDTLLLPQLRGTPAIMTVDVWGNSAVWVEDV
ncbi:MAG: site-specific DNA-methyltransferase [Clostridiales bacterium]|nr:site-specific DNA-methyltransferase [Clostridiales bacterium]